MDKQEILDQLGVIFNDILEPDEEIQLNEESTAEDISEWDSLAHIQLIVAIEKEFDTRFTTTEVGEFVNVGDMVATLQKKAENG